MMRNDRNLAAFPLSREEELELKKEMQAERKAKAPREKQADPEAQKVLQSTADRSVLKIDAKVDGKKNVTVIHADQKIVTALGDIVETAKAWMGKQHPHSVVSVAGVELI